MTYDELLDKIEEYLPVRENEKDKFGEVFTPPILINELLDQLPKYVWTDPTLKWLDPASGTGNFFMLVFYRLMTGLAKKIPNKNKRSNHILQNMLYMVDINPKNIKIALTIFGKDSNIQCADFLLQHNNNNNKEEQTYDIIIGNLPFNEETNENNKKTVALWPKFVIKSLEILNTNGFLAFIHPPNWRSPDNKTNLWKLLTHKHILYLHIYGPEETKELFHVNTKVDLYVLQNKQINKNQKTTVIDELGKKHQLHLPDLPFLSNYKIKEMTHLLTINNNNNNNNLKVIYNTFYSTSTTKEIKNNTFKYPVISSITNGNKIHLRYTDSNKNGHFNISKVIINGGRYPYPYNDYAGKYGMSQNVFAIPIAFKKQGDDIVKALNSVEFNAILKAAKWTTFAIDYKLFKHFKSDFYKYFIKKDNITLRNSSKKKSKQTRKK